ncbi:MAG TPA: hypothetical protein VFB80_19320 [Pirellulaceae bacterium]|nr:hypothetical protein [Pirellulaceae bacterium]
MPTLAELRNRTSVVRTSVNVSKPKEEALVADRRSGLRPAHIVEQKLTVALSKSKS